MNNTEIHQVISFSDFFPGLTIDIREELKRFSREDLLNVASVLSLNYGNAFLPDSDSTFFSKSSRVHIDELNERYENYVQHHLHGQRRRVYYCSYRTTLQFIRYVFSIPYNEFQDTVLEEDFEYILFQVLIAINEEIYEINNDSDDLSEIYFYLQYAMNDMNMYSLNQIVPSQCYYAGMLFDFLHNSSSCKDLYAAFLQELGINDWKEYEFTVLSVIIWFERLKGAKVNPKFTLTDFSDEIQSKLSVSTLDKISIPFDACIPFDSSNKVNRNNNVDYRGFRGAPLVKTQDGRYHLINHQMLAELIYNNLFFVLSKLYSHNFSAFYNKRFVEEYLFHRTILRLVKDQKELFYFPDEATILSTNAIDEERNQPDFYIRHNKNLFIFECKAFKLNGLYKEKGSICPLVEEYQKKIVHAENQKGKDKDKAVRQIVNHILRIEEDKFQWDKKIPDDVTYYPIIVLEDPKLVNAGIASKIQEWYQEELKRVRLIEDEFDETFCPVITLSIYTLHRYSNEFKRLGWEKILNLYIDRCATFNKESGWRLKLDFSFDEFMQRRYVAHKDETFIRFYQSILKS